jgi:hypothetical protein
MTTQYTRTSSIEVPYAMPDFDDSDDSDAFTRKWEQSRRERLARACTIIESLSSNWLSLAAMGE